MAFSTSHSLFAMTLLVSVSVGKVGIMLKPEQLQDIQRERSVFVATYELYWQMDLLPFCLTGSWGMMIPLCLKVAVW